MVTRILIVDDKAEKISNILVALNKVGIERHDVEIAQNAFDARRLLQTKRYELLILDLSLPARPEDQPKPDGGLELLQDIKERDVFNVPPFIVGLTAYGDLKKNFDQGFQDKFSLIIHYDQTSQEWSERIGHLIEQIKRTQSMSISRDYQTDVCIISALREPEMQAIRNLPWDWKGDEPIDEATFVNSAALSMKGEAYSVVSACASRMGMVSATLLTAKLIYKYRPRLLIMAGICAGLKDEVSIGDVILANPAWDWQSGKWLTEQNGAQFAIDPDQLDIDEIVTSRFRYIAEDVSYWSEVRNRWPGRKPNTVMSLHNGPVASGSSVIADISKLDQIRLQNRKLLGVDMEIYGVYAAPRSTGTPAPITFAIKGVSDHADAQKDDRFRDYAAYASANVINRMLEQLLPIVRHS